MMLDSERDVFERALDREKRSHNETASILEKTSEELSEARLQLKLANERLKTLLGENREYFNGIYETILEPYVVADLESRIIKMNDAAREFFGNGADKTPIFLLNEVHPEDLKYTYQSIEKLLKVGFIRNFNTRIRIVDGTYRHIRVNGSVIRDTEGQAVAVHGIVRDVSPEVEMERLLWKQRQQLDFIVENSPFGIALTEDDKVLRTNYTLAKMLGYTQNQLSKMHVSELTHPEDYPSNNALYQKSKLKQWDSFVVEKRYVRKDGSWFWARTRVNLIRSKDLKVRYDVAFIEDITREKEMDRKLAISTNNLSALIRNLNIGILFEDKNRNIQNTNSTFLKLFSIPVPVEELLGVNCEQAVSLAKDLFVYPERFIADIDEIVARKQARVNDELELKDGRTFLRDYVPIFSGGEFQGHLWSYTDITPMKNYRLNLERENTKYQNVLSNMQIGLVEVDRNNRIERVNEQYCLMSGYEETELVGKITPEVIKVKDASILADKLKLRLEGIADSYEVEAQNKQGTWRHWLVSGAPRRNEAGEVVGSIGMHLDITENKLRESRLQELIHEVTRSNRDLEEYAHMVSHDLKSPLRSIHTLTSWLMMDFRDKLGPNGVKQLEKIQTSVEGMDELIDKILQYSSINGSQEKPESFSLREMIEEICRTLCISKNVTVSIAGRLPVITAQKIHFHQLFQNLIGNALAHNKGRKLNIEIGFSQRKDRFEFHVTDNGIGIAPQHQHKIFELFQSLDQEDRSTGIGLAIVKKIVELYRGEIWVESEPGQGASFRFTLPKL